MINLGITADWCTREPIAPYFCTPRVQQVHTEAEVVQLTPGLTGFVAVFNSHA